MIYALHKFFQYLLTTPFVFYTCHMTLKYLVNKPILQRCIFQWIFLFQEFDFTVVVKPGKSNSGPDHLSRIQSGEEAQTIEETIPDAQTCVRTTQRMADGLLDLGARFDRHRALCYSQQYTNALAYESCAAGEGRNQQPAVRRQQHI